MVLSQENHRKLASVIVASANNRDAIALNKALAACLYDFPLFVEAVSRASSNSDNETIYKLVRMGLDLNSWKKIAEKAGDKNVYQMMIDTRRSNAAGVTTPGGVVFTNLLTDRTGTAAAAGTVTISLHDVMNGMVTINDTAAVSVPGSGKLVGASSTSSNVTFCNKTDLVGLNTAIRPNCTKFTGHFTHAKSVNASSATSGAGISFIRDCLFPCTVAGFKNLTSAASNLKFDYYYAGITESELNQVWGYHRTAPEMPATRDLTSHSSLTFLVRALNSATAANAGVVGNGWFTSVFENSSDAAISTNYQTKTDATNKNEALTANSYSTGEFYSGYPEAADILNGLNKNGGWNATRLVALGLEYRDIQNAGFPIDLRDFANDKTPSDFLTSVMGYTVSSGVYSYNGVVQEAISVLRDLKAGGYSLTDLKNDATILTFLQTYNATAGSSMVAAQQIYPGEATLKDRVGQFGGYTTLAATLGSVITFTDASTYATNSKQYFKPIKDIFGEMNAQQLVDALYELDQNGLSMSNIPAPATGGVWPSSWTRKDLIACKFVMLAGQAANADDLLVRYLHAIGMNNDAEGMAKIMQRFAYWDVPANYNERNHSDLKFRSALASVYVSSNLPTDDFYELFGTAYQQYIHEAAGPNEPLVKGMGWERYYKSESGYQPHQLYNIFLNVNRVPAAAKAAYVVPNTDTADTWAAIAVGGNLVAVLGGNTGQGWPLISTTAGDKPWGATINTLTTGQDLGSKWIDSTDTVDVEAQINMHLLLSPYGYNMSVEEFLQSPALSATTGPANDEGLLQFTANTTDDEVARVLNVLTYVADDNAPSFNMLKTLVALEKDRIGEIFHETAAATSGGAGVITAANRAKIVTAAYGRDNKLGDSLFSILKANPNDGDNLDIGVVLVGHLKDSQGGNVGTTNFDAGTFLAAESAILDMKTHLTKYPGQIWAAIQDEGTAAQQQNLEEVFVAAYLRLSDSEKAEFFAEAKKWNESPARLVADMVNAQNLSAVVLQVYAKQETNSLGLVAYYESGVARLPASEIAKIKAALN